MLQTFCHRIHCHGWGCVESYALGVVWFSSCSEKTDVLLKVGYILVYCNAFGYVRAFYQAFLPFLMEG